MVKATKLPTTLILALDPATYTTGYAILNYDPNKKEKYVELIKFGYFDIPKGLGYGHRMHLLREKVLLLLKMSKAKQMIIEKPFLGPNPNTFMLLSGGYGILTGIAYEKGVPIIAIPPSDAKVLFCGTSRMKGKESKKKIRKILESLYEVTFTKDDESDAVATGITGVEKYLAQGIDTHY
jgi:Holliday junction resolvasome RuvABC endonuclease subunit